MVLFFPLLSHQRVDQNLLKAVQRFFSMVSPNSSQPRVFASVTTEATFLLVCWYQLRRPKRPKKAEDPFFSLPAFLATGVTIGFGVAATTGTEHIARNMAAWTQCPLPPLTGTLPDTYSGSVRPGRHPPTPLKAVISWQLSSPEYSRHEATCPMTQPQTWWS